MSQSLYYVDAKVRQKVPLMFGRTLIEADNDVKIITNWIKAQPHLPEIMEEVKIRNFLIMCKFSIEKTKQKIDMYYTIRSLIPDWFDNCNPKLQHMKRFLDHTIWAVHPVAFEDMYRVLFVKTLEPNTYAPCDQVIYLFNIFETRLYEDCMVGDLIIMDMANITLSDMRKVTPSITSKAFGIYEKVYSLRMKSLYVINSPGYIDFLVKIFKAIMKPKLFDRIHFHQDAKILTELFNKEFLPKDYGGEGPTLKELSEMVKFKIDQYQDRFDQLDKLRVNESLRPEKLNNDEVLGYYGNFKQLSID